MADEQTGGHNPVPRENSSSTVTCRLCNASASQAFSIDPDLVARRAYDRYRMRGGEHAVPIAIDDRAFALRITAPQHEHETVSLAIEHFDDAIRERLPAPALVRCRP